MSKEREDPRSAGTRRSRAKARALGLLYGPRVPRQAARPRRKREPSPLERARRLADGVAALGPAGETRLSRFAEKLGFEFGLFSDLAPDGCTFGLVGPGDELSFLITEDFLTGTGTVRLWQPVGEWRSRTI